MDDRSKITRALIARLEPPRESRELSPDWDESATEDDFQEHYGEMLRGDR